MKRCPNGTRRRNGICVKKGEISKKRCPNGTRRRNGRCVKKGEISKKRCPNGTRRRNGHCVKKSASNKKPSSDKKSTKYIVTFYNSNHQQIKDMDYTIDDPEEFIERVEETTHVNNIIPMKDQYIPDYIKAMKLHKTDIDDEELASVWFCDTDKNVNTSYDISYDGKIYVAKFHNI